MKIWQLHYDGDTFDSWVSNFLGGFYNTKSGYLLTYRLFW